MEQFIAMLMTIHRLVVYLIMVPPILQHFVPVTAACMGAIALLLMGLWLYLSRLLATRLTPIFYDIKPLSPLQKKQLRQQLLDQVKREVAQVTAQPERLALTHLPHHELPWNGELRVGQKAVKLTLTRHLLEAFRQPQLAQRLLILGAAGAGKTTFLMNLVEAYLARSPADSDQPLPILLNLSSWTRECLSFEQWFLIELKGKYGLCLNLGQDWLKTQQFLPFLEGFDELDPRLQGSCLEAINRFQKMFQLPGLVVCSQPEPYQRCAVPLNIVGTIWLQPLTLGQVQAYLKAIASKHPQGIAQPPIWQTIHKNPQLMRLAQSPLLLHFLLVLDPPCSVNHAHELLTLYLKKYLGRDNFYSVSPHAPEPQPSQTLHWLSWLARNLQKHGQSEFLIGRMQPSWLPSQGQRRLYRIGVGLTAAGLVGTIAVITNWISNLGITSPVFWGTIAGAIAVFPHQISFVETLSWSPNQARRGLILGLWQGTVASFCLGVFLVAIGAVIFIIDPIYLETIEAALLRGSILSVVIIFSTGLMGALLTGWLGNPIEHQTFLNLGIWHSAKNTLIFALTGFGVGLLLTGVFSSIANLFFNLVSSVVSIPLALRILYYPPVVLKTGIMIGAIGGLIVSISCLQHFILRVILWYNGSIPWNYDRFLRHVSQRMLIQPLGRRYRFTNSLLRNYLARSYSSASLSSSKYSEESVMGSKNT
ncbi:MAG: hypothetical protein HC781_05960 [Leptolyngbyaceae cyanobacterium CSU_1_4]|nr:hypothetical protein [Leptolyngbyaceae cyanobacterium CSU_1_4]